MRFISCLVIFIMYSLTAFALEYVELGSRGAGMFSIFNSVLRCLDDYERGTIAGLEVNFYNRGAYFDKEYGPNWWQYYCEPVMLGKREGAEIKQQRSSRDRFMSREYAHELIQKHIHIKPHITNKVEAFQLAHFRSCFVIGIHYRGTDKIIEAPRVAYEEVVEQLMAKIERLTQQYVLFVATDEEPFLEYIQWAFPGKVCYQADVIRSANEKPLHIRAPSNRYKLGEDALTDCLILSNTDLLIRTNSNLSLWSTYFSPKLPVIELNQRYKKGGPS